MNFIFLFIVLYPFRIYIHFSVLFHLEYILNAYNTINRKMKFTSIYTCGYVSELLERNSTGSVVQ